MPGITEEHAKHYREHGYAIVAPFLTPEELAGARDELRQALPGWVEYCDDPTLPKPTQPTPARAPNHQFPFAGEWLNTITLHPELRRFAAENIGHDDIYCEQSHLAAKFKGAPADQDQVMHCDYGNHTLAYPPNLPEYWQTAYLLYYTDVTADHAPTAICSWQHYPDPIRWPAHFKREERPDLYEKERKVVVPAGSLLIYSMRTFHRGTPFVADAGRLGHFITYAPAAFKWLGIVGWSAQAIKPAFRQWVEQASTEERELLGFPPPGHSYWTDETIAGVSARYPGMDMTPYRAAAGD